MTDFERDKPVLSAGIDDATKCPVIGSIMLAGVVADEATIAHWHQIGVKDSKLLTRKRRDELSRIICTSWKTFDTIASLDDISDDPFQHPRPKRTLH